jgi:long-subunit acyl-CoA synthetase (AMP-forming)
MAQNIASTHFNAEQWSAVDQAIDQLGAALTPVLVALGADQRRRLVRMGDGSAAFVRKTLDVINDNLHVMPRNFDVDEMRRDVETHDALNARTVRLMQLMEKLRDTDAALGSDAMVAALQGYQFLKSAGKGEGVDALRRMLGERFEGNGNRNTTPPTTQAD